MRRAARHVWSALILATAIQGCATTGLGPRGEPPEPVPAPGRAGGPKPTRKTTELEPREETTAPTPPHGDAPASVPRPAEPEPEDLEAVEAEVRGPTSTLPAARGCEQARRAPGASKKRRMIWPVEGVVVSGFGQREGTPHDGIDIAAPVGTPIWASRDGEVLYSGERSGYGLLVILGHEDGTVTIYAHNSKNCVPEKKRVTQGDVVALVGASGGATSSVVHFEVRVANKAVNPRGQLPD